MVEETTFGTIPPSPTFISCGAINDLVTNIDIAMFRNRQLGSRDFYQEVKAAENYGIVMKYQPYNTNFLKYGTEYYNAGATGNISKSFSIVWSQLINNVENFFLATGCRTEKLEIAITEPKVEVTQTLVAKNISTPTTSFLLAGGTGTPTYCAPNAGAPWSGLNGGVAPLTINALSYDLVTFKAGVTQNLDKVRPLGNTLLQFLEPTNRDISVDFEVVFKDTVNMADLKTFTARTASYSLNTGSSTTLNFTNLYLEKFTSPDSPTANKIKTATFAGAAQQITVVN
jgi:hypothetical protein